ncbi:MAG: chaperonin GroEL [Planctomycetota bacterium]
MSKQMIFDQDARRQLSDGVQKLAHAVATTLGPGGRNVLLDKGSSVAVMTKDGVTVAKDIELEHPFENMGAKLVCEVANRTNREVGDGTTTSVVLTDALINEGMKYMMAGVSPVAMRRGMERAKDEAVAALKDLATPISGRKAIEQVGLIASNGDVELARQFADAVTSVGENGVIKVEENSGVDTVVEYVSGMEFDKGFISPYFITDPNDRIARLENAQILITDHKISSLRDLVPLLEKSLPTQRPLFIVADDVEGEALAGLILNRLRGVLQVAAIKAPGFGDRRKAMLEDLAVATGGKFLSKDLGFDWSTITPADLGSCKKIEVHKEKTQIFNGAGKKADIEMRLQQIESQIAETTSSYDKEKLEERRGRLTGKIAIIRIGGHSEVAMKERKMRADDALNATRAAVAEGIVPGSGTAYIRAAVRVRKLSATGDEKFGTEIVARALTEPLNRLARNAGLDGPAVVAEVEELATNQGYDLLQRKVVDLVKAGIVDPLKVVRVALENAVSISALHLVSSSVITEVKEGKRAVQGALT